MARVSDQDYDLFNHVQDSELRNHNRAVYIANMYEDNTPKGTKAVNQLGAIRIMKYFSEIPKEDKKEVLEKS